MRLALIVSCALCLGGAAAPAAEPCGTPAGLCQVAEGAYRLALPEDAQTPVPALIYLHGWGASAQGVMRNTAMRDALTARGYALIAPQGVPRPSHDNRDWGVRDGGSHPRDDLAFLAAVLDDAARHGVERGRVLMAGFSRGGSMVWDVACHAPATARAYAPVAGAFWEPLPQRCAGPVDLLHTHGWTDRVVPLEGRAVAGGRLVQGDAFLGLRRLRETLECAPQMPDSVEIEGGQWRRQWTQCPGGRLDLVLHPGGHGVPAGWLGHALEWFEDRLADR